MDRRAFLGAAVGTALTAGVAAEADGGGPGTEAPKDPPVARRGAGDVVRVGVIGTGGRGTGLLATLLGVPNVEVPAVCDIDEAAAARASGVLTGAGRPVPETYTRDEHDYRRLLDRDDLDAVLIATPWEWHTPMAADAMRKGKYAGVEVPCSQTLEECWELVETRERTGVPCMMLENWSFRRDNLAVLRMIRAGLLGEIVHCHCAHSHDCIDHWFFDPEGNDRWAAKYLIERNCDQYPTHSLGPVLSWMDVNCGDALDTLTSTATESRGINAYFARKFGPDHPSAKRKYKQGDIVSSVARTKRGKSIVINYDMQLPRPYDNRWMIQGLLGLYDEDRAVVYLEGKSPQYHEWEPFGPYQEQYLHPWWKEIEGNEGGHGGTDYLELLRFVDAVRAGTETPIDVYDSVTMSSIVALSGMSIARHGAPVDCPDFTRGRWRTRKPSFAVVPTETPA
jgi:predicted dehydrogenase